MPPVIKDNKFEGEDDGLVLPVRRLTDGPFELRIDNLDREDPPSPYKPGHVPRTGIFNRNVFTLPVRGGMPEIKVGLKIAGFDAATTPVIWRLQSLHVLGRFHRKGGTKTDPQYWAKIVSLGDEWRGDSKASEFTLFPEESPPSAHVGGGHAILTVAVKPPGATGWLQDFVHLRIIGANPDSDAVRKQIRTALPGRDPNLWSMLDAIFAWEAGYKQFRSKAYSGDKYKGVSFKWPSDPAWFPVSSFDFGVGLSQFTHPDQLTASIAWDWRDNMSSGINIFLDALRGSYKKDITWIDWALKGWKGYNGSADYAKARAESDDGKLVSKAPTPKGLLVKALTETVPLIGAPTWPAWPPEAELVGSSEDFARVATESGSAVDTIVDAVTAKVTDRAALLWMWPQLETQVLGFKDQPNAPLFPGLDAGKIKELHKHRSSSELKAALDHARTVALRYFEGPELEASGTLMAASASSASTLAEWNKLSAFVRGNISGGFAGYQKLRTNLLGQFGALDDPDKAIKRINAYYGKLTGAAFPKSTNAAPVHPNLKDCLAKGKAIANAKGATAALDSIGKIGGFNIRPNANDPTKLSLHSFGWAVDIDWDVNPNVKKAVLPLAIIEAVTGVDLYGAQSKLLRVPAAYDTMLPAAQVLAQANADFKAAFANRDGLKSAMQSAVKRLCGITLSAADLKSVDGFATAQPAELGRVRDLLVGLGVALATAKSTAKLLGNAADLFRRAAKVTKPVANGPDDATIAHFGFFNHEPELVAALASSDGAGLRWLGAANGTKDYMHFELFAADTPELF
jgi:hypothetical protein